ncbi:hypothetical protein P43SY_011175 [Pythium insidiosum]|uniref:Uncharacterized protein n=1 Tax=Pythium insidiosum TaxID=114742 RepID=A0AAD5LZD2_PYTIN|nr:hypothetical protein P43SY_011175 [Pythium insidiosum]
MPGMTAVVPIVYGRRFAQQLQVWLCRGPNWLTTLVVDEEGRPKSVRVANVSTKPVVLAARTAVAHLVEEGHLPDRTTRGDGPTARVMLAEARTAPESADPVERPVLPAERLA